MDNHHPQLNKKFIELVLSAAVLLSVGFGLNWLNLENTQAASGINTQLNYQGKLTTSAGVQVSDASWNFRFRIYSASSAGTLLWTERWNSTTTRATTVNGVFSVALGSLGQANLLSSLNWNSDSLYLQVDLDADNNGTWEENFGTRKRLTASAYAFNADMLDGYNATTTAAASSTIPVFDKNLTLNLFGGGVSSTMATTTNLYVGRNATTTGSMDASAYCISGTNCIAVWPTGSSGGQSFQATTTDKSGNVLAGLSPWITSTTTASWYAPQDLFVGGNATTTGRVVIGNVNPTNNFGSLWVGGNSWFNGSATTTGVLEVSQYATTTGGFFTQGSGWFGQSATSSKSLYVGNQLNVATTSPWAGYEFALAGDQVLTGNLLGLGYGQFNNVSTTDTLYAGGYASTTGGLFTQGNLRIGGDATTTGSLWLATTTNSEIGVIYSGTDPFIHRYGAEGNTFVGRNAGNFTHTVDGNTGIGELTLNNLTSGDRNTGLGYLALRTNTTGSYNTAQGYAAMKLNSSGNNNTAQGLYSLYDNTSGSFNTAQGTYSLFNNSAATSSVGIGASALLSQTTGAANTALGFNAGYGGEGQYQNITGRRNIFLGANSGPTQTNLENAVAIGASSTVALSNAMALGGVAGLAVKVGITTSTPAYKLTINADEAASNLVQVATTTNQHIFTITNQGKIGISTSTPSAMLGITNYYDADNSIYVSSGAHLTIGGVWTDASSVELKENFIPLDNNEILNKILGLSLKEYNYITEPDATKHFGAMAEDWYSAFGLGDSASISGKDTAMIALAGLQALSLKIDGLNLNASSAEPLTVIDNPDSNINTLAVQEAATFYGTIYVRGQAGFESQVVFNQDIEVKGKIYASPDQAGTAVILANATSTEIVFAKEYEVAPKIVATARKPVALGIINQTIKGFRVFVNEPAAEDLIFDWLALAVKDGGVVAGAESVSEPPPEPVLGCLDSAAQNYNPSATRDDGSCQYPSTTEPVTEPIVEPSAEPLIEPLPAEELIVEPEPPPTEIAPVEPASEPVL